jgi:hypothetical protein
VNFNKVNKYFEYFQTKLKVLIKEKKYFNDGYHLKYILEQYDNDILLIVFSGCTREGVTARYNYNRTLNSIKANKLFILDDFGYDKRGAYYLGHNMDFKIQEVVKKLISKIQSDLNIKNSIYIGTSKGGYAALNFGLLQKESIIIAGAPQYFLGNYLNSGSYIENCLQYIVGKNVTKENLDLLNNILLNKVIQCSKNDNEIYLHFSNKEHTYENHVKYLISDLESNNYSFHLDVADYPNHSDVSLYFPKYLLKTLSDIMKSV